MYYIKHRYTSSILNVMTFKPDRVLLKVRYFIDNQMRKMDMLRI